MHMHPRPVFGVASDSRRFEIPGHDLKRGGWSVFGRPRSVCGLLGNKNGSLILGNTTTPILCDRD